MNTPKPLTPSRRSRLPLVPLLSVAALIGAGLWWLWPLSEQRLLDDAARYVKSKNYRTAEQLCLQVLKSRPDSASALEEWYHYVRATEWANGAAVRQSFRTADYVGNERFVFNIKGNHYRLIASISFTTRTVCIKFIGIHRQYDTVDAATVEFIRP